MTLAHQRPLGAANNFRARYLPNNNIEFGMFRSVTFQIVVTAATGSPSSWSLSGALRVGAANLTGPVFSSDPIWREMTARELIAHSRTGGPIQYGTNVPPVIFKSPWDTNKLAQITIDNPPNLLALVLEDPAFVGGTDPTLFVSANAICEL